MDINKKHKKDTPFVQILFHAAVNSHHNIIKELQLDITKDLLPFLDNIADIIVLKAQTTPLQNEVLISVVYLTILYYVRNKHSNVV